MLEPFLFSADPSFVDVITDGTESSVAAVVVDWERKGKSERQAAATARIGTDTQIGTDTPDDLARVASVAQVPVLCRVNAVGPHTRAEIDLAAGLGADEVLVPMVRRVTEVEDVLALAAGRVGVGVMIETIQAAAEADQITALPLTRVYVGLMDLALDRGSTSIFDALADGTVEHLSRQVTVPFGFGGLTVPGGGHPVPTTLLLAEMVRLNASFTFLRRSFMSDIGAGDPRAGIRDIRRAIARTVARGDDEIGADQRSLATLLERMRQQREVVT